MSAVALPNLTAPERDLLEACVSLRPYGLGPHLGVGKRATAIRLELRGLLQARPGRAGWDITELGAAAIGRAGWWAEESAGGEHV